MYFGQKKSTCKTEERKCKSLLALLKYSMSLKLDGSMADDLSAFICKGNLLSGGESKPLSPSSLWNYLIFCLSIHNILIDA
ncbi:hypothetical protein DV515_00018002 [Chloebia gouldiae]|uniref:Uncharacterized protein n=1 Tax=Chloebia gouldiae TaxID=44316 RepID=A0A3L8Q8Q5_CHLGU|nr:hypothetical protein DV515_00018002 [Chloebia gouldiae]